MNKELGDLYKNRSDRRRLTTKKTYPDGSYESETISFPKRLPCWCYSTTANNCVIFRTGEIVIQGSWLWNLVYKEVSIQDTNLFKICAIR